jgi:hypothetical protein
MVGLACTGAHGGNEQATGSIQSLLEPQWQVVERESGGNAASGPDTVWTYRVSPPFPDHWPPGSPPGLIRYAYAAGFDVRGGLVGAERVAAPWGRVIVIPKTETPPRFEPISQRIREIGIQGVRPLTSGERAVYEQAASAESALARLTAVPDEEAKDTLLVRGYYCAWIGHNGTVANELRPYHPGFFEWLGCRSPTPSVS